MDAGGARDCATVQIGRGWGDWKKRNGRVSCTSINKNVNPVLGGKATEVACVAQNGQCSRWVESCVAEPGSSPLSALTLTNFEPPTLQISAHVAPREIDKACDTDGASAANSIAKQATQAAKRRVSFFIPIQKLYQCKHNSANGCE